MNALPRFTTINGYSFGEVASALQKSIRRGDVDAALYWAVELYESNFDGYAWKRMRIIVSEDIGPANPLLPAVVAALYQTFLDLKKKKDAKNQPERLPFVHAVILLAASPKSRIVDNALIAHFFTHHGDRREVPDYALDKHTVRGRNMGRGFEHFFTHGAKLHPVGELDAAPLADGTSLHDLADQYERFARELLTSKVAPARQPSPQLSFDDFEDETP